MNPSEFAKRGTESANKYEPINDPNKKYGWVYDYARFRFDWVFARSKHMEEKAETLLKAIAAIVVALWPMVAYLKANSAALRWESVTLVVMATTALVIAGILTTKCLVPTKHLMPVDEDVLLRIVDAEPTEETAKGKFCQIMTATILAEMEFFSEQGVRLQRAFTATAISVALFLAAFSWTLFQ